MNDIQVLPLWIKCRLDREVRVQLEANEDPHLRTLQRAAVTPVQT